MLRFSRRVRKALFERLAELPEEFARNAEISFYSIRDTLFHVVRTEDFWVNGFLTDHGRLVRRKEKEELKSALDLERLWDGVSDRTEAFIQSLTTVDLQQVRYHRTENGGGVPLHLHDSRGLSQGRGPRRSLAGRP
jgi:uncharacterized damage-inducible protein DinB